MEFETNAADLKLIPGADQHGQHQVWKEVGKLDCICH
jgi:hypothetical protein